MLTLERHHNSLMSLVCDNGWRSNLLWLIWYLASQGGYFQSIWWWQAGPLGWFKHVRLTRGQLTPSDDYQERDRTELYMYSVTLYRPLSQLQTTNTSTSSLSFLIPTFKLDQAVKGNLANTLCVHAQYVNH